VTPEQQAVDYEIDLLDARPDAETDAEARARIEESAPRACGRCCGTSDELDPERPGGFRICRACLGSGVEGGDSDLLCPDCDQPAIPGRYSDACGACMDRLVAAIAADEADAPDDDPPAPAEAVLLYAEGFVRGAFGRAA
jgi:hypothetical protein